MTSRVDPLYEYQKEEVEAAKSNFNRVLNVPWPQRGKGLPHDWIQAPFILLTFGILIPLWFAWWNNYGRSSQGLLFLISAGIAYVLWLWLPSQIYNSNILTCRHTFRRYPAIRRSIQAFKQEGEEFRKHLPVLIVDGKKYFMINYHRPADFRRHGFQKRMGIVLLNEAMQLVDNDELFRKAFLVENLSFIVATEERTKDLRYIRDKYKLTNTLNEGKKILERHRVRFEQQGIDVFWSRLMTAFPLLHAAVDESSTIPGSVHEKIRRALGYSFAVEFLYEDALYLNEVRHAFVQHMTASYMAPLSTAKANGAMLVVSIIKEQKHTDRQVLLTLEKLRIIEEGVLAIMDRFDREGVVQAEDWEYYHRKVELARKIGWPITKE